jgi:hypothetical protein
MIREAFRRFYSSVATDYTESAIGRKRSEHERLSRDVAEYLARGGRISQLPYGAVVAVRAKRRRYGRLPNA